MQEKLFTVERVLDEDKIEIHLNDSGLNYFIEQLENLKKFKTGSIEQDHLHLFTKTYGGDELTDEMQNHQTVAVLVNHLKIFLWN